MALASTRALAAAVAGMVLLPVSHRRLGVVAATSSLPVPGPGPLRVAPGPGAGPDSVFGVFEGRTPCGSIATEFTGFPASHCEKIKWRLTLYRDPATGRPSTYWYEGTRAARRGRWAMERGGRAQGGRAVYRLTYGSGKVLSLLSIDDDVLLLLDPGGRALVGNASWSYVLNRTDRRRGAAALDDLVRPPMF